MDLGIHNVKVSAMSRKGVEEVISKAGGATVVNQKHGVTTERQNGAAQYIARVINAMGTMRRSA